MGGQRRIDVDLGCWCVVGGEWDWDRGETVSAVPRACHRGLRCGCLFHDAREDNTRSCVCTYQGKKDDSMRGGSFSLSRLLLVVGCRLSSVAVIRIRQLCRPHPIIISGTRSRSRPRSPHLFLTKPASISSHRIAFLSSSPSHLGGITPTNQRLQRRGQLGPQDPWYYHNHPSECLTEAVVQPAGQGREKKG